MTHEALFIAWPQLSDALVRQTQRFNCRLERAAADGEREGREPSMLWRGQQLRPAREAVDVATGWSDVQRDFVGEALMADADRLRREADILADHIRASGLVERDSELTLQPRLQAVLFPRTDGRIDVTPSRYPVDVVERARRHVFRDQPRGSVVVLLVTTTTLPQIR